MLISNTERALLRLNLQFFADEGGAGESGTNAGTDNNGAKAGTDAGTQGTQAAEGAKTPETDTERLERLIQSRVDRALADERKKSADLQKKYDAVSKANLNAEELRQAEIKEREDAIAAKEKELLDRELRLYAIGSIKKSGLDDGSDKALELVDFVMGEDEKTIDARVKSFNDLVKRFVSAQVDQTFKQNGRVPNGAKADTGKSDTKTVNIAETLGKQAAETSKKTNDVLSFYTGGKK